MLDTSTQVDFVSGIRNFLVAIGENPDRDDLIGTPNRVARMLGELLDGYKAEAEFHKRHAKIFESDNRELVICQNIEVNSVCAHHLLPFFGSCNIGYLPDGKVLGLSKFPRLVKVFAHRLQKQEDLTEQIASSIEKLLSCKGLIVTISCKHLCCTSRGVRDRGVVMKTSAVRGKFGGEVRAEFFSLIGGSNADF